MALEIERKFLVDGDCFTPYGLPYKILQGYLSTSGGKVIRIRTINESAFITIKSSVNGIIRHEYEYEIPFPDALELLKLCEGEPVIKTRWKIEIGGKIWEIDVFEEANKGLIIAEIELDSEEETFEKPPWVTKEVSVDQRYFNFNLSKKPYQTWQ